MHIVFLGFAISDEDLAGLATEDCRVGVAAHKLQWNIIRGLEECNQGVLDLVSSYPISDFPAGRRLFVRGKSWSHAENAVDRVIPHVNLIFLKHLTRLAACSYELQARARKRKASIVEEHVTVVYALHSAHLVAAVAVKAVFGGTVVIIVPDLPEYMDLSARRSLIRRIAKSLDGVLMRALLGGVDGMVVLTEAIAQRLSTRIPAIVIEGMISSSGAQTAEDIAGDDSSSSEDSIVVMYAGVLAKKYGVELLLDAFELIDDKRYVLALYGRGEMEDEIRRRAASDPRIRFAGFAPNDVILQAERAATVLVNVRNSDDSYTKFSFPSKVLEYLASGTPVICTRLGGIPSEYFEHLIVLEDETPLALANLLRRVCSKSQDELDAIGRSGREFVLGSKNSIAQSRKIFQFVASLAKSQP